MKVKEGKQLVKLVDELQSLLNVRITAHMQMSQGIVIDRVRWVVVKKEATRLIRMKEDEIAALLPSGTFQRKLDLRYP